MDKEYKIEIRPTIFHITVSFGEYSDYCEEHYFLRANSPKEAQLFFKKYWKDTKENNNWRECLVFKNGEQYNPFNIKKPDWETSYGDANDVHIEMMPLICFQDYKL